MTENITETKESNDLFRWIAIILVSFILGLGLNAALKPTSISGISMSPTLEDGDKILLNIFKKNHEYGDIVVFNSPKESLFVKRVIGLEGDRVQIQDGQVYLNGKLLDEKYIKEDDYTSFHIDVTVPKGEVFLLGDNRNRSSDSREFGTISKDEIIGSFMTQMSFTKKVEQVDGSIYINEEATTVD